MKYYLTPTGHEFIEEGLASYLPRRVIKRLPTKTRLKAQSEKDARVFKRGAKERTKEKEVDDRIRATPEDRKHRAEGAARAERTIKRIHQSVQST